LENFEIGRVDAEQIFLELEWMQNHNSL